MNSILLKNLLQPLNDLLLQPDISEISINRPGELWIERNGVMTCTKLSALTLNYLKDLSKLVATHTEQCISAEHPLLAAFLPGGYRIQIVYPPAVQDDTVGISIRKSSLQERELEWHPSQTALNTESEPFNQNLNLVPKTSKELLDLYKNGHYKDFLELAVHQRCNILISGGTSTGKTTFLNHLLQKIPNKERIITLEDIPEIKVTQPNFLSLYASRNRQGRAIIDMQDLVEASLRLRPDRMIIGELRGIEAFSFLRAINTGHPGSIATLHADSPALAFEQLILMVMQKNLGLTRDHIKTYIHSIINVVVQLKRGEHGARYVAEIYFRAHTSHF